MWDAGREIEWLRLSALGTYQYDPGLRRVIITFATLVVTLISSCGTLLERLIPVR
jgi:hypothetical protein